MENKSKSTPKIVAVEYRPWVSFYALLAKEVYRFRKIALQAALAPILTSMLYLMVFGSVLSDRMPTREGVSYIDFLIPGLVMMMLLQNSFANAASSLLHAKFIGNIVYFQMAPFSAWHWSGAYVLASSLRGMVVGSGVFLVSLFWSQPTIQHPIWMLTFAVLSSFLMGTLGGICGLWAEKWDQLGAFQNFVIMPLTFLSGVFYSVDALAPVWQTLSLANPFFYIMDGFRFGFFGQSDFNPMVSLGVVFISWISTFGLLTWLFSIGYKLRR